MLAFTQAHAAGADALDTDMFATSDGVLVLFHDETLEHRTSCSGAISSKTYAQLLQCDFAYWWTQDGGATYPYRGQGVQVVTVQQLLTAFPGARIGLEIKQTTPLAAASLCTLIKQNNAQGRMLISSTTLPNMLTFRTFCPAVATSATQEEVISFYLFSNTVFLPSYNPPFSSLQVPEVFSGIPVLTADFVADAHTYNMKVYAWTIDTPEQAQHFIDLGVDGINTSYPQRILDWLATQ